MRRHPPGLYVLFVTEMWERFGFYTMAALFVLYMKDKTNGSPFLQDWASSINGIYLGTVYFTPFFGGILADQKLGYRWSIILGAIVFAIGYVLLAAHPALYFAQQQGYEFATTGPLLQATDSLTFFWAGLALIVIGNGLFKPNISTLVGKLYSPGDPRLDSAYSIFYMGINVGALAAPLVASVVRPAFGYHVGFAVAGVGMALSLLFFLPFQRWLVFTISQPADPTSQPEAPREVQRQRHIALLIIFVVVALFWMGFKQNSNTFQLWFRDVTDRTAPSWWPFTWGLDDKGWFAQELSASINPFYVIVLTPLLVAVWRWLRSWGKEPSTPMKIAIGMAFAAAAFVLLAVAGLMGGDQPDTRVSSAWLFEAYAIITVAELCLSPMGLSLVSKLAAPRQKSAWMGGWFAATAIGGYLSGFIGQFWDHWTHSSFFAVLALTSLAAGVLLMLFYRRLDNAINSLKSPSA